MKLLCVASSLLLSAVSLLAQDEVSSTSRPSGDLSEAGHPVRFQPGVAASPLAPGFSPKGTQITLAAKAIDGLAGKDVLAGRIPLGPAATRGGGQVVAVARSEAEKPYDLLYFDSNLDGSLADEKPVLTKPSVTREKWWSSFSATLRVDHAAKGESAVAIDYPVSFWIVVEKPAETPTVLRFSRRGFLVGVVAIGDATYDVAVADHDNDACFGSGDDWSISPSGVTTKKPIGDWRRIGEFAWGGDKAWKLTMDGTSGRTGTIRPFDPGVTRAEDEAARDRLKEDRAAPRAKIPVAFQADFEAVVKEAAAAGKPYFVKFETDWCGPCKDMTRYVFTAKDVADAADGIACVLVDGDKRKDLVEKFGVAGYPTGILLDSKGAELARFSGYQGVKSMSAFFRNAKP